MVSGRLGLVAWGWRPGGGGVGLARPGFGAGLEIPSSSRDPAYSAPNACIGSAWVARNPRPTSATVRNASTTPGKVIGLVGLVPRGPPWIPGFVGRRVGMGGRQSWRNAWIGSTREARRAGRRLAPAATPSSRRASDR